MCVKWASMFLKQFLCVFPFIRKYIFKGFLKDVNCQTTDVTEVLAA